MIPNVHVPSLPPLPPAIILEATNGTSFLCTARAVWDNGQWTNVGWVAVGKRLMTETPVWG